MVVEKEEPEESAKFCSVCGCDSFAIDSRYINGVIRRRRQCSGCGRRWSTEEKKIIFKRKHGGTR